MFSIRYMMGLCLLILVHIQASAQLIYQDTISRTARISYQMGVDNQVSFGPELPPLQQMAGAPKAYYTQYWEFGDGSYSFEEKPKHQYKKKGDYTVRLWNTNHYDNGKAPSTRPQKIRIDKDLSQASLEPEKSFFAAGEDLDVLNNRDPIPNEEMVLITSYKNTENYTTSGELYLFYNEVDFKNKNFELTDTRLHYGEKIASDIADYASNYDFGDSQYYTASAQDGLYHLNIPQANPMDLSLDLLLAESQAKYRDMQRITFDNLEAGEERHIFRTLQTTPEMIKDTTAIVSLRTIFVPDKTQDKKSVKDTELEILSSHDPNRMASNGVLMNYRFVKNREVKFKVRFQNDGEGPANTIRLEIDTPDLFDKSSLQLIDTYPKVALCVKNETPTQSCIDTLSTEDKLIFTFRNIYLPGSNQKNVKVRDSTKGFVKYSLKFGEELKKVKTRSRTAIYFDKNEPVYTNYSATRFLPGISIGAKAGYIYTPKYDKSTEVFVGASISPYKSHRSYLQAELFFSAASFEDLKRSNLKLDPGSEQGIIENSISELDSKNIRAYLVPVSYRYNFSKYFALGAGAQFYVDLHEKQDKILTTWESFYYTQDREEIIEYETDKETRITTDKKSFTNFNSGVFIDMSLGSVRIGPSLGLRYAYHFSEPKSQWQVYATWKF